MSDHGPLPPTGEPQLAFASNFPDALLGFTNLSRDHVAWAAVHGESRTRRLVADALDLEVILAPSPAGRDAGYLLVVARHAEDRLIIILALSVPMRFVHPVPSPNPLVVLQRFAELVGLQVQVGDRVGTLIFDESIPLSQDPDTSQDLVHISNPKNHTLAAISFVRLERKEPLFVLHCAFVLALDVERYRRVVRGHDPDSDVVIDLAPSLEGRFSARQLLEPTATIVLWQTVDEIRKQASGVLFRIEAAGYLLEIGFRSGLGYIRRNDTELVYSLSPAALTKPGRAMWTFSWSMTELTVSLHDPSFDDELSAANTAAERSAVQERRTHRVETRPIAIPDSARRWLRERGLVRKRQYRSAGELWSTVREALEDIDHLIMETGKPNPFWDISYDGQRITSRQPKVETDCHAAIQLLLDKAGLAKNLEIVPEYPTGGGQLDFMVLGILESGDFAKVCVEFKHAHSKDLTHGLLNQLPAYMKSQGATHGLYGVLWFKGREFDEPHLEEDPLAVRGEKDYLRNGLMGRLYESLPGTNIEVVVIDASRRVTPSKT